MLLVAAGCCILCIDGILDGWGNVEGIDVCVVRRMVVSANDWDDVSISVRLGDSIERKTWESSFLGRLTDDIFSYMVHGAFRIASCMLECKWDRYERHDMLVWRIASRYRVNVHSQIPQAPIPIYNFQKKVKTKGSVNPWRLSCRGCLSPMFWACC